MVSLSRLLPSLVFPPAGESGPALVTVPIGIGTASFSEGCFISPKTMKYEKELDLYITLSSHFSF
jgi:hypothetical protein